MKTRTVRRKKHLGVINQNADADGKLIVVRNDH